MKKLNITNSEMATIIVGGILSALINIGIDIASQRDINEQIDEKIEAKLNSESRKN